MRREEAGPEKVSFGDTEFDMAVAHLGGGSKGSQGNWAEEERSGVEK